MATSCNCQRGLIVIVVVLTLAVVLLVAILAWRESGRQDKQETDTQITEELINRTYPLYFRTLQRQQAYFQQYLYGFENPVLVNSTIESGEQCRFACQKGEFFLRRKRAVQVYHGCCVSSVTFYAPTVETNIFGQTKTFLQLKSIKQFFPQHNCQSLSGCSGCTCAQQSDLHTAVVLKSGVTSADDVDDTEIDFFYFPGCCRCINN